VPAAAPIGVAALPQRSRALVQELVIGRILTRHEIPVAIVPTDAVDVVHLSPRREWVTERRLHDHAVHATRTTGCRDLVVPFHSLLANVVALNKPARLSAPHTEASVRPR